jgi:glyoxalase family protein
MNPMVIKGVNSQTFMAANLARVEKFYRDFLGLPVVK